MAYFMPKNKFMTQFSKTNTSSIPNFFKYGITGTTFAYNYELNRLKCNRILDHFLHSHKNLKVNKIRGYAAKITTFLGLYIEYLTNEKLTKTEFRNLCLAGAITPIYDRFCDNPSISKEDLQLLTFNPSEFERDDKYKGLYTHLLLDLRKHLTNIENFNSECERVMSAQLESRLQNQRIDIKTVDSLTMEKGGASFLFWASTLNRSFTELEKKIFYQLGGFVQIIDDIFDIAQDLEQGVETFATKWISDIEKIELKLEESIQQNVELVNAFDISKSKKRKLIRLYYLLAIPAFIYLKRLRIEAKKDDLLIDKKTLKPNYIWNGWTPKYFISMCLYLIKN